MKFPADSRASVVLTSLESLRGVTMDHFLLSLHFYRNVIKKKLLVLLCETVFACFLCSLCSISEHQQSNSIVFKGAKIYGLASDSIFFFLFSDFLTCCMVIQETHNCALILQTKQHSDQNYIHLVETAVQWRRTDAGRESHLKTIASSRGYFPFMLTLSSCFLASDFRSKTNQDGRTEVCLMARKKQMCYFMSHFISRHMLGLFIFVVKFCFFSLPARIFPVSSVGTCAVSQCFMTHFRRTSV